MGIRMSCSLAGNMKYDRKWRTARIPRFPPLGILALAAYDVTTSSHRIVDWGLPSPEAQRAQITWKVHDTPPWCAMRCAGGH